MRKKILTYILSFALLCVSTDTIEAKGDTLQADGQYHVVNVDKKGNYEIIKTTNNYSEAKVSHTVLQSKYNNLGITYGDSFLTIEQGVVSFTSASDCSVNTNYLVDNSDQSGYTNACYGNDAAFLEYNTANGNVKFKLSGVVGWVDGEDVSIYPIEHVPSVSSFIVKDKELLHRIKSSTLSKTYANTISLSKAPSYLKENTTYYSYDSHYFYTSFQNMISDYRDGTYKKAVNKDTPYYNFYQYMSHRTTSSYSPKQLNAYFEDTMALQRNMTHFTGNYIHTILTQSLLYKQGDAFFQYQNQFGSNALMMLSLSINESALGRSYIAYTKNNLFGHAAYDSSAEESASRYTSVGASVYSHALHYIANSYLKPGEFQYHGGYFGNKAGGMNVSYASDPYWGEKAAHYYYTMDSSMGFKDYETYAIGVSDRKSVPVYKKASIKSDMLYAGSDGYDSAFILLEKVKNKEGSFYRVQTDASYTKDKTIVEDGSYSFKTSVGYIRSSDVSTLSNTDEIDNKSYVTITFDAVDGTFYPDTPRITMQVETGKTPVVSAPQKEHALFKGWDIKLDSANVNLTYKAQYRFVKSIQLVEKVKTKYDVNETLDIQGGVLRIHFTDGKQEDVNVTGDMIREFSTSEEGTHSVGITYAGCTTHYEITVQNNAAQEKQELLDRGAYIIKTYSGKTGLTSEAMEEVERYREDIRKHKDSILSMDQIRVIDRIIQENLKPRYSVLIHDDIFDLQVSGLSLALEAKPNFLHKFMPKTIEIDVDNEVSSEDEALLKKVAKANNMQISSMLSIQGSEDFSSLKPTSDMVFSIRKLKGDKNQRNYRIYYVDGEDVIQLPYAQSDSRILFQTSHIGSFAIVYQNRDSKEDSQDFTEVNTIKQNGKNYIKTYILLPIGILTLMVLMAIAYLVYRKRYRNKMRIKKQNQRNLTEEKEERNHE